MKENKNILIVGGDSRQKHLAELLSREFTVYALGFDFAPDIDKKVNLVTTTLGFDVYLDYIILPMPVTSDGVMVNNQFSKKPINIDDVLALANKKTVVLGGKIDTPLITKLSSRGLDYTDYLEREELAILNAIPTAEGAIGIAMDETATTIYGSKCLIVGYGRISKVLSRLLLAMGADVIVSARNYKDLAWIKANGAKAINTYHIGDIIGEQKIVFNTVPAKVLGEDILSKVKKDCVLIDLASKPGGIDFEIAKQLNLKTIWALSLPGIVAPITAAEIIFDTIKNIMHERRLSYEED